MINKTELFESAQCVLNDIETILYYNSTGSYYLPEDCGGELTYKFFGQDLTVEFDWEETDAFETNLVLGDYYNNESTIKISLRNSCQIDFDTISNIGEVVTHEMTHWLQEMDGVIFPNAENIDDDKYYLQQHEIEAQYYGFEFQSRYSNTTLEEAVDRWFEKYAQFHNFQNNEKFKKNLLTQFNEFSQKELYT